METHITPLRKNNNQSLAEKCISEYEEYLNACTIVQILNSFCKLKENLKLEGAEIEIRFPSELNRNPKTPDAFMTHGRDGAICVEIKSGRGGDYSGIISELDAAYEYCQATSWRAGSSRRTVKSCDTFFICFHEYWEKVRWGLRNTSEGRKFAETIKSPGFMILSWARNDDKVVITKQRGESSYSELNTFFSEHELMQTEHALLLGNAEYIFIPMKPPVQYTALEIMMTLVPSMPLTIKRVGEDIDSDTRVFSFDDLYKHAKQYFPPSRIGDSDQIRRSWLSNALEMLESCGLANKDDGKYSVKIRNSTKKEKMIDRICKKIFKNQQKKQKSRKSRKRLKASKDQSLLEPFFLAGSGNSDDDEALEG